MAETSLPFSKKSKKLCAIPECGRKHYGKGYCQMHHHRWRRHGDPLGASLWFAPVEVRFWSKVNKNGPVHPVLQTRCWEWQGATSSGYGAINANGRATPTHRLSFFLAHGKWPEPCCLHKCDNPPCVRPDHLFEGTHADNTRDMVSKGRGAPQLGKRKRTRTHCPNGHEYIPENILQGAKERRCRICRRATARRNYEQRQVRARLRINTR